TRDPSRTKGVFSSTGVWGDATLATAEKGKVLVTALVEHIASDLARIARDAWEPDPPRERYL
ncbi:MAG: hypothetical protein ACYTFT_16650, partial [Planctomycetota bacterium]